MNTEDLLSAASDAAKMIDADVYLYSGAIERGYDLLCIEEVSKACEVGKRDKAILVLVTGGGNPDAAYKIARYFQEKYSKFTLLVPGLCKSAGTLIAVGANELVFTPFGELGPLDIQVGKVDKFDAPQSGLAIQEAFTTLESRATASFYKIVADYMSANDGLLSYSLATQAAASFVTQLYAPVMARIDPEEVGARSRSMQIAREYGKRLNIRAQNLKSDTSLTQLAEKYPSHSFVIDHRDALGLFKEVREANAAEKALVAALGDVARYPRPKSDASTKRGAGLLFRVLSAPSSLKGTASNGKIDRRGRAAANGAGAPGATRAAKLPPRLGRAKRSATAARKPANGHAG